MRGISNANDVYFHNKQEITETKIWEIKWRKKEKADD